MKRATTRYETAVRNNNRVRGVPLFNNNHIRGDKWANASQDVHGGPYPRGLTILKRDRINIPHPMSMVFESTDLIPHINQGSVDIYEDLDAAHDAIHTVQLLSTDAETSAGH